MDKHKIISLLKSYSKKTIHKSVMESLFNTKSDEVLFNLIYNNQELLKPIISSRTNGNIRYPIYMKYRIILPEEQGYDYSDEIRKLHPMLQSNGWLISHQIEYKNTLHCLIRLTLIYSPANQTMNPSQERNVPFLYLVKKRY